MNLKDLRELIELVKATEVAELEWERSGVRVRIRRGETTPGRWGPTEAAVVAHGPSPGAPPDARAVSPEPKEGGVLIRSPIVGTFYRAASPEAAPYVEIGDRVRRGQILCIVEAMKLMNEIESEVDGVVTEAFVENARPVEYGEALFRIEPG